MRPTRICVLGGSGFVGTQLCAALSRAGRQVSVPTRSVARARHLGVMPAVRRISCDVHDPVQLRQVVAGHDAVINLVGVLNAPGRRGEGFRRIHAELPRKLVAACREARVDRLLHVSALNADADHGPSHYLRSKGEGERIIRDESGPDLRWTILQPSLIFGRDDSFTTRLAGLLQRIPQVLPLARAEVRLSPVWVGDVVAALVACLGDDDTAGDVYQLCGPETLTLREVAIHLRDVLRLRRAIVGLPDPLARLQAAVLDFLPGKPFSTDNYRSLTVDSVCTADGLARLGIRRHALSAVVPSYLDVDGGRRLDHLRRRARR